MMHTEKHHVVGVYIISDTRPHKALLLNHRKLGVWIQPGGHQESWENSLEASAREVREETGLDITQFLPAPTQLGEAVALPVPSYITEEAIPAFASEPAHIHIDQIYVVHTPIQPVNHNERESHDIGWFTAAELDDLSIFESTRTLLKRELAK